MTAKLNKQNKQYWQTYKPGTIPSVPQNPPDELLRSVEGPVLDVGTGDGMLAEDLARKGLDVYGFDKELAGKINTKKDLKNAIRDNKISRIVKHYTIKELKAVFSSLELSKCRVIEATSPSGFTLNTFEGI